MWNLGNYNYDYAHSFSGKDFDNGYIYDYSCFFFGADFKSNALYWYIGSLDDIQKVIKLWKKKLEKM